MFKHAKRFAVGLLLGIFKRYNPLFLKNNEPLRKLREKAIYSDIYFFSNLQEYQKKDTVEILKVIFNYFPSPRDIVVLDVGCDATVTKYLSGYVKRIVGINTNKDYMKIDVCPENVELLVMDAANLKFQDKTFDFVFSANVYEHLTDLSKCIDEQLRVIKDDGYVYAMWDPIWSSGKGHHIHEDMIRIWEDHYKVEHSSYKNNGLVIKDWEHLLLSKEEMLKGLLLHFKSREVAEHVVRYIYEFKDINRNSFDDVKRIFDGRPLKIVIWEKQQKSPPAEILQKLESKYGQHDFSTAGCRVVFSK